MTAPPEIMMHPTRMSFSSAICGNLPTASIAHRSSQKCHSSFKRNQIFVAFPEAQKRENHGPLVIRTVRNKLKSDIHNDDNGSSEPAVTIPERPVAKTQKLEKRTKEDDIQDAERNVLLENALLKRTKEDLEYREREIAAASAKQKQMEEDLKKANTVLASRSIEIEDLRLLVEEQDKVIASSQSALVLKEDEMNKLRDELLKKNEEATIMSSELRSKEQLLNDTDELVKNQEEKIQQLKREVAEKEHDLSKSLQLRKAEEERLIIAEASLEKQTLDWLSAREELMQLAYQVTKQVDDVKGAYEEFEIVRALLAEVRSELISTRESLSLSRRKIEEQSLQFAKQLSELSKEKVLLISLLESLKQAHEEVEIEKTNLRSARARCNVLESHFTIEKGLMASVQEELRKERSRVEQQNQGITLLQKELQQKQLDYSTAQNLLQVKKSELLEASLQIEQMKSEQVSLQLLLQEKDFDLLNAKKELADASHGIAEIQRLLNRQEERLIQATAGSEKEEYVSVTPYEIDDMKLKFSDVTSSVQRIAVLTDNLVSSVKDSESSVLLLLNEENLMCDLERDSGIMKKELETELGTTKELLGEKDKEVVATNRALELKEEELRSVDTREKERKKLKEELQKDSEGLEEVCVLSQGGIGDQTVGELGVEKEVQRNSFQLEAEAAISALQRLTEMIHQLTGMDESSSMNLDRMKFFEGVEKEISELCALSEQLVKQAGITSTAMQH